MTAIGATSPFDPVFAKIGNRPLIGADREGRRMPTRAMPRTGWAASGGKERPFTLKAVLFDDLIGEIEHAWRHDEAESLGGLEIDH
jgi:hypothetical protein